MVLVFRTHWCSVSNCIDLSDSFRSFFGQRRINTCFSLSQTQNTISAKKNQKIYPFFFCSKLMRPFLRTTGCGELKKYFFTKKSIFLSFMITKPYLYLPAACCIVSGEFKRINSKSFGCLVVCTKVLGSFLKGDFETFFQYDPKLGENR